VLVPAVSIVVLAAAIVGLVVLDRGPLAPPPLTSIDDLDAWLDARSPAVAVFALVRLVCLGLAGYLLALLGLSLLARLTRSPPMRRVADAATPPGLRRATAALFGVGLVGAASTSLLDRGAGPTETLAVVDRLLPGEPTERLVPLDEDGTAADGQATVRLLPPHATTPGVPAAPAAPALEPWLVQPGDHLWSIAESHLGDALGRIPTDAEIAPYWRRLIEHNRLRLADPDEPDLIFPGQVFELPPPSP
jgi:hypothetical protein